MTTGDGPFSSCYFLTEIKVAEGNTKCKDIDGNLYTYDGTTLIQYAVAKTDTTFAIPQGVTSIGDGAFSYCTSLTSIEIPVSVTAIGFGAFRDCTSLTDVYYTGSEEEWAKIIIEDNNDYLKNATIHFNSK